MSLSPRAHRRYVQEVLIDEAAKTADALVRVQLSKVAETPVASALRTALRTPKQVSEAALNVLPLPDTIKDSALAPARLLEELGEIGPSLARANAVDEETAEAAEGLWKRFGPKPPASDATAELPGMALERVQELADPESDARTSIGKVQAQLPALGVLSRRFGAPRLRRAAERLETSEGDGGERGPLTRAVGDALSGPARTLADAVDEPRPTPPADSGRH